MKIKMNEGAVALSLRFWLFSFILVLLAGKSEKPREEHDVVWFECVARRDSVIKEKSEAEVKKKIRIVHAISSHVECVCVCALELET